MLNLEIIKCRDDFETRRLRNKDELNTIQHDKMHKDHPTLKWR